jgi:hypothetical protein
MKLRPALVIGLLCVAAAVAQGRRPGGRSGGMRPGNAGPSGDVLQSAVVHFEGTLRSLEKKSLRIDLDDGQSLVFRRTKNTSLVAASGHSQLDVGDKVQVEAHKDKTGDLDAVRVCEGSCPATRP